MTGVSKLRLPRPAFVARRRQRGVVLLFALISVLILMIAAVALIRSVNSSLFSAGNIAFKRDLQNESELAIQAALKDFRTGGLLVTHAQRAQDVPAANYSARTLQATNLNHQNIPLALQSTSAMSSTSNSPSGFTALDPAVSANRVSTRYVIERLCDSAGDEVTLGTGHCLIANAALPGNQGLDQQNAGNNPIAATCGNGPCQSAQSLGIVYRITVRAEGPRNTLSFFQSTITAP